MANPADMAPIAQGTFWLPKASSNLAREVDFGWDVAMWVSVAFFALVIIPMFYFAFRYRRRHEGELPPPTGHNTPLEIFWTVVPLIVVMGCFLVGFQGFVHSSIAPADAYVINVTGAKWLWTFSYPGAENFQSPGELRIPAGKPVKLVMSSKDVIHSFFIPEFRTKQDVVPGNYTSEWFTAEPSLMKDPRVTKDDKGFPVLTLTAECTEYCGREHSGMLAKVVVMSPADFDKWLELQGDDPTKPPEKKGQELFAKFQCTTCHSLTDKPIAGGGPAFKGVYGRTEKLDTGAEQLVSDDYIKESVMYPQKKIVMGFGKIMPSFQGQINDKQLDYLIAYLKTIK
jgi:cytochrome c oxidase subunit 2